jgi:Zn-dependent protease/CBS domain-containing protein
MARRHGVPVRGITLFVFGGIAQIEEDARRPGAEFAIAVAGPVTSFALTAIFLGAWIATGSSDSTGGIIWEWLWLMNLAIGLLNLIPTAPFDGGRIIRALGWGATGDFQEGSRVAGYVGQAAGYALVGAGILSLLSPSWWPLDMDPLTGLWFVLIGLFLENSARNSYHEAVIQDVVSNRSAGEVMIRDYSTVDRDSSVTDLLAGPLNNGSNYAFVTEDSRVVGIVSGSAARGIAEHERTAQTAGGIMVAAHDVQVAQSDERLIDVLKRMDAAKLSFIPIVEDGRLAGLITRENVDAVLNGGSPANDSEDLPPDEPRSPRVEPDPADPS